MDERDVLAIHERLLALHGGASGLRDAGLLQSALARPRQHFTYDRGDLIALASIYTGGIVRNHPFLDGNKRTGFVIGALFLEMNGYRLTASEPDAAQAVIALAGNKITEDGYAAFLKANVKRRR
jgi:death-on-curing protein